MTDAAYDPAEWRLLDHVAPEADFQRDAEFKADRWDRRLLRRLWAWWRVRRESPDPGHVCSKCSEAFRRGCEAGYREHHVFALRMADRASWYRRSLALAEREIRVLKRHRDQG